MWRKSARRRHCRINEALCSPAWCSLLPDCFWLRGIITLGRFFTVDVAIERDHELVERGPFRVVRHPSYTGVLLGVFVGLALTLDNWAALLVILLPIGAAFIHRMNVEEHALSGALGSEHTHYMRRTKRLVPFVY